MLFFVYVSVEKSNLAVIACLKQKPTYNKKILFLQVPSQTGFTERNRSLIQFYQSLVFLVLNKFKYFSCI
jgi:hypothetical protein